MSKRFTDTDKYKKPFFRGLQGAYKLLWDYLYHDCNNAGIWIKDFEIAQIFLGSDMKVSEEKALEIFNKDQKRIVIINGGEKWFIPAFVEFQYGELNPDNRAHKSVIDQLNKYSDQIEIKGLTRGLQGAMDKDKDKDKDKEGGIPLLENFLSYSKDICSKGKIDYEKLKFGLEAKYQTWVEDGWKDGNGKPIKNWKTKVGNVIPYLKPMEVSKGIGVVPTEPQVFKHG